MIPKDWVGEQVTVDFVKEVEPFIGTLVEAGPEGILVQRRVEPLSAEDHTFIPWTAILFVTKAR